LVFYRVINKSVIILISSLLKKECEVQVDSRKITSPRSIGLTANKNWKKWPGVQSVLIHIRFKFSTRRVDICYRLNSGGWYRNWRVLMEHLMC